MRHQRKRATGCPPPTRLRPARRVATAAPVPPSPEDTELFRALAKQARATFPGAEETPYLFQAGTDAGAWRSRGVPVYGIYPYPISAEELTRMHGNDERVSVGSLRQGTEMVTRRSWMSRVALNRALSKLGILSRTQATAAIRAGRVRIDGRVVSDPAHLIVPERARITVDGEVRARRHWRTILFYKPRGVVTTRRDPEGRRTIYDVLGDAAHGLIAVGRLDLATTGVLLLTNDTHLANWIADPVNAVPRVYAVTVRGETTPPQLRALSAANVTLRKASGRESHLIVELRGGKNRQVRRMFATIGHEVTRLRRVSLGGLELGRLEPGEWREVTREELRAAFPGARISARPS